MKAQWEAFEADIEGTPAWILFNATAAHELPNLDLPNLLRVQFDYEGDEDGAPLPAEEDRMQELETELEDWISAIGGRFVGQVTADGSRTLFFYVSCGREEAENLLRRIAVRRNMDLGMPQPTATGWRNHAPSNTRPASPTAIRPSPSPTGPARTASWWTAFFPPLRNANTSCSSSTGSPHRFRRSSTPIPPPSPPWPASLAAPTRAGRRNCGCRYDKTGEPKGRGRTWSLPFSHVQAPSDRRKTAATCENGMSPMPGRQLPRWQEPSPKSFE